MAWAFVIVGATYWTIVSIATLRTVNALRVVAAGDAPVAGAGDASLSIIVAARDEAVTFRHELDVLEALEHSDLELVLVDDRSTDATGTLMDEVAALDARVRVIHVDTLADGWLGKVHALEQGRAVARGTWLLFTDADVQLAPQLPRRAITWAEANDLDCLALLPQVRSDGVLVAGVVGTFSRWLLTGAKLWRAADPDDAEAFGVGACNLVRADALERVGGFGPLRMDVADDAALAQAIGASGGRTMLASGVGLVQVRWQDSVRGMTRGFEKYGGSGGVGSIPAAIALVSLALLGEVAPWIGLVIAAAGSSMVPALAGGVVIIASTLVAAYGARRSGGPAKGLLAGPLAPALVWWMQVRAALLELRRGGIVWRGTFYSTAQVRAGKRYRMPIGRDAHR